MAETDVLFQRGKVEDNEDIWDDTALIKAYDEAVSLMKVKAAEQNGLSMTDEDLMKSPSSKKNRKRGRTKKPRKWKVGERCRARFTDDQCLYDAEILSVDESAGTCYVRYADYGNEEEQFLRDLLRLHRRKQKHVQESENETDSGMEWKSGHSTQPATRSTSHPAMGPPSWPGPSQSTRQAAFPGPMFPPGMPPQPGNFNSVPRMAFMPPPPPPPALGEMGREKNEALCSMLMSWYMSGYHTGYYQGLQQAKKDAGIGSPFASR